MKKGLEEELEGRGREAKKEFLSDLLSKVENKWFTADCIPDDAVILESWFNKWIKELKEKHDII